MRKIIVISGHGNYAAGIRSTLELLAGKNEDLFYVDFTAEDTDITLMEKFKAIVDENKDLEILFVCDLLGGTPFKVAAEVSNSSDRMELVAGCNVGGILEMVFSKDAYSIGELADKMVEQSKNSTLRFKKIDVSSKSTINIPEGDGI